MITPSSVLINDVSPLARENKGAHRIIHKKKRRNFSIAVVKNLSGNKQNLMGLNYLRME
jgi:hypothetical protein